MASLRKNVASQNLTFCMVSATTGAADASATVTVNVTKDNGSQAAGAGTVTNSGNGQYNYAPTQAETNATDVGFLFTATGDIPVNIDFHTDLVDANGNLSVDAVYINGVSTSSVTTVNANLGTTSAITFDGNGAVKSDVVDIAGSAVSTSSAQLGVNVVDVNAIAASSVTTINAVLGTSVSPNLDASGNAYIVSNIKKDTAQNDFMFMMYSSSTGLPATGLTVTAQRSLDGAAFANCANAVTELSNGTYTINLAATDTNANHVMLKFTATGALQFNIEIITQP